MGQRVKTKERNGDATWSFSNDFFINIHRESQYIIIVHIAFVSETVVVRDQLNYIYSLSSHRHDFMEKRYILITPHGKIQGDNGALQFMHQSSQLNPPSNFN